MWFIFLIFATTNAYNEAYIKNCLQLVDPYTSTVPADTIIHNIETCLGRVYLSFPPNLKNEAKTQIQSCITTIGEQTQSKTEYRAIENKIAQFTSNVGSSVITTQHSIAQLAVCAEPLKKLTGRDIYEESELEEVVHSFIFNIKDTNTCIQNTMTSVQLNVVNMEHQLEKHQHLYNNWKLRTNDRQNKVNQCKQQMQLLKDRAFKDIVRESNS